MAMHLPVIHTIGCSGCVRITECNHYQVSYLCIIGLGIHNKRFSSHGDGDGWFIVGKWNVQGMFKRGAVRWAFTSMHCQWVLMIVIGGATSWALLYNQFREWRMVFWCGSTKLCCNFASVPRGIQTVLCGQTDTVIFTGNIQPICTIYTCVRSSMKWW